MKLSPRVLAKAGRGFRAVIIRIAPPQPRIAPLSQELLPLSLREGAFLAFPFGEGAARRRRQTVKKLLNKLAGCNEGRPVLHFLRPALLRKAEARASGLRSPSGCPRPCGRLWRRSHPQNRLCRFEGRIPPPPVADEGGRRPSEQRSAGGGSALHDYCELRGSVGTTASSIIFLIAPRPRCGGSRVSGGNLRVAAPSASLKLGALAVK